MLTRETVFEIHRLKDEGYSARRIAEKLKISRGSVRRYLKNPEKTLEPRKKRSSCLDPFKLFIDECLKEDPKVSAPVVLRMIKEKGYFGQISILGDYLKNKRGHIAPQKAFIRFESEPGEQCQVDWGHFDSITYGDTKRKLYALAVIESYSRMLYVEFTHSQNQETLHGCLWNAFHYFKGLPRTLVVDNMLTAVTERESKLVRFNAAFLDFLRPLHIVPKACNVRSPFEKGKIENSIKYLRNNFMPLKKFKNLADIQSQVLIWLDQIANTRVHQTTSQIPKDRLLKHPLKPLSALSSKPLEGLNPLVRKDYCIKFDTNFYTTPPWTISKRVTVKADQHTIWIYYKDKEICSYPRCWDRKKRIETEAHKQQVKKLERKQWESRDVALFASLGEEFRRYLELLPRSNLSLKKQISKLLILKDQYGVQSLSWAILKGLNGNAYGSDYIENILYQEMTPTCEHPPVKLKDETLNRLRLTEPTLIDYDAVILKKRHDHDRKTDHPK